MISITNIEEALDVALTAHRDQKDLYGTSYISHVLSVWNKVKNQNNEDEQIVAILHDVFEDSDYKIEDFKFINPLIKDALIRLTHNKDISYKTYIDNCYQNELSRKVKIADLENNLEMERVKTKLILNARKFGERIIKYVTSINYLKGTNHDLF